MSGLSQTIDHADLAPALIEQIRRQVLGDDSAAEEAAPSAAVGAEVAQGEAIEAEPSEAAVGLATQSEPAPDDEEDIIPLAPEDTTDDRQLQTCPVCFHKYPRNVGVCANCGFDEKVGIASSRFIDVPKHPPKTHHKAHAAEHKPYACPHCGYDMAGSPSLQCPECGHVMPTRSQAMREELAERTVYEAYHTPRVLLAIGLTGLLVLGLVQFGWPALVVLPVVLTAQVTAGMLVAYTCMFFWIGFDAPFHLNLLRMSAATSMSLLIGLVVVALLGPVLGMVCFVIAYLTLFLQLLDFEFVDAAAVAILTLLLGIYGLLIVPRFIGVIA